MHAFHMLQGLTFTATFTSIDNEECKFNVYSKRQTSDSSSKYKISRKKQLKTILMPLWINNCVKLLNYV